MKLIKLFIIIFIFNHTSFSQVIILDSIKADEKKYYKDETIKLIKDFQDYKNALGSDSYTFVEKMRLLSNKLDYFENNSVVIENDLLSIDRTSSRVKVDRYLKNIDLFFKKITFKLSIISIGELYIANNKLFIKIKVEKDINGIYADNSNLKKNLIRFLEIQISPKKNEFKIVSIYTTVLVDEVAKRKKEEEIKYLRKWWDKLSLDWKSELREQIKISRITPTDKQLIKISNISDLFIANNKNIISLEPIKNFTKLKSFYLYKTSVMSLEPLKNLKNLRILYFYDTKISNLKYINKLKKLKYLSFYKTEVDDLDALKELRNIHTIYFQNTKVKDISSLGNMRNLKEIYCHDTEVEDLSPLKNLNKLRYLNCKNTKVKDISILSGLKNLEVIIFENTKVNSLDSLKNLKRLKIINCKNTEISEENIEKFKKRFPEVKVNF